MEFYVNATGLVALSLSVTSYLMRSHVKLTMTAAAAVLTWALHFYLQEAWTASAIALVMSLRVAAGVMVVHLASAHRWAATFLGWLISGLAAALTWAGETSVPSTVASLFLVWAGFHLHYGPLRIALLAAEVLWFINGWMLQSPTAMVAAVVGATINLVVLRQESVRPAGSRGEQPT